MSREIVVPGVADPDESPRLTPARQKEHAMRPIIGRARRRRAIPMKAAMKVLKVLLSNGIFKQRPAILEL
jgi:hypothetical protein